MDGIFCWAHSSSFIIWAMFGEECDRTNPRPELSPGISLDNGIVYSEGFAAAAKFKMNFS